MDGEERLAGLEDPQYTYTAWRRRLTSYLQPETGKPSKPKPAQKAPEKGDRWKVIAAVVIIGVLVLALGIDLSGSLGSKPLPASVTTAPLCSTDTNATLPCGRAAGSEGNFVMTAASLVLSKHDPGAGNLTLTIYHTGLYAGTEIYVSISPYGFTDYIQALRVQASGQSSNYTAPIPSSFGLASGQRYEIKVDSLLNSATQGQVLEELDYSLVASGP